MAETGVRAEAGALAAAVSLLTRVPVGSRVHIGDSDVARSLAWLPLVGAAIGGALRARGRALEGRLDAGPAAVLLVAAWALATGAIHLDGLADSADGLGGRDREQPPRDHARRADRLLRRARTGAGGGAQDLPRRRRPRARTPPLADGGPGRRAPRSVGARVPRFRTRASTAPAPRSCGGGWRVERLAVALATAMIVALACARLRGLLAVAAAALVALAIGRLAMQRIGGITGDVLGAAIELAECAALLALIAGR